MRALAASGQFDRTADAADFEFPRVAVEADLPPLTLLTSSRRPPVPVTVTSALTVLICSSAACGTRMSRTESSICAFEPQLNQPDDSGFSTSISIREPLPSMRRPLLPAQRAADFDAIVFPTVDGHCAAHVGNIDARRGIGTRLPGDRRCG
ncbi:MAG: hypothetical protein IPQ17_10895 [Xanthomonadales bacterium]|nr:hypothetical protein [Xanthomonadales bacterium]